MRGVALKLHQWFRGGVPPVLEGSGLSPQAGVVCAGSR
jgi:hypothetical protein